MKVFENDDLTVSCFYNSLGDSMVEFEITTEFDDDEVVVCTELLTLAEFAQMIKTVHDFFAKGARG